MDDEADDELAMQEHLLEDFRARGERIAGDDSVCERCAEETLGLARGTLAQRRARGTLTYHPRLEGNRYWYRIAELAAALVAGKR